MRNPLVLADDCQAEAKRMARVYGKGYATAQRLLREAAVELRRAAAEDEIVVLQQATYLLNKRNEIETAGALLEVIDWHTNHV